MEQNKKWPTNENQPPKYHNLNVNELKGRFANGFSITTNGKQVIIDFFVEAPVEDGTVGKIFLSRTFLTPEILMLLHANIQKLAKKFQPSQQKNLPPAQ